MYLLSAVRDYFMASLTSSDAYPDFQPSMVDESGKVKILVHPLTNRPTQAWETLKNKQVHRKVQRLPVDAPISPHKVRFVCVSDTHNRTDNMVPVPNGDVLLHGGDFTSVGTWAQVQHFNDWLGTLPHKHKVVIAGNHELSFERSERNSVAKFRRASLERPEELNGVDNIRKLLTNCIYIEDAEVQVAGFRIYGSPWQPEFGGWAYNLPRGEECLEKWDKIPEGVDILMTHGPPIGHGDYTFGGVRAGCVELLHTIQHRVKPKYHIFGHIHEDPGITSDGKTKFINASSCTLRYKCKNAPILFDLDLPEGRTKEDVLFPSGSHGYTLNYGKEVKHVDTDFEEMETDEVENSHAEMSNSSKGEKAENFLDYCEMADVSDELNNLDMGLKLK